MSELEKFTSQIEELDKGLEKKFQEYDQRLNSLNDELIDVQQKGVKLDRGAVNNGGPGLGKSIVESEQWKQFAAGNTKHAKLTLDVPLFEIKNTITGDTGSPASPGDILSPATRMPGVAGGAFRSLVLRDVIPVMPAGSNLVEYTRETSFTNNAAPQTAEGEVKAESVLAFELVEAPVRTTAHFIKMSRQALSDNPSIGAYIEQRMRHGVGVAEQNGFITGDGTGSNFDGLITNATTYTPSTGDTAIDSLNRAAEAISTGDFTADTIILNPADWFAITRLKNGNDDYYLGVQNAPASLWGLNVIVTNSMTSGKMLVGDMLNGAIIWDRQMVVVDVFEQNEDDVERNLVTVRAENRSCITVTRPAALRAGDLTL